MLSSIQLTAGMQVERVEKLLTQDTTRPLKQGSLAYRPGYNHFTHKGKGGGVRLRLSGVGAPNPQLSGAPLP